MKLRYFSGPREQLTAVDAVDECPEETHKYHKQY